MAAQPLAAASCLILLLIEEPLSALDNRHVAQPYANTRFHTEGGDKDNRDGSF